MLSVAKPYKSLPGNFPRAPLTKPRSLFEHLGGTLQEEKYQQ